jgi:hypothetical protein
VRPPQDRRLVRVSPRRGPSCVPAVPVRATDALGLSPTDLHAAGDAPLPVAVHARARDVGALCGRAMRQRQPASRFCGAGPVEPLLCLRRSACRCRLPAIGLSLPLTHIADGSHGRGGRNAASRPARTAPSGSAVPYSRSQGFCTRQPCRTSVICPCFLISTHISGGQLRQGRCPRSVVTATTAWCRWAYRNVVGWVRRVVSLRCARVLWPGGCREIDRVWV